MQEGWRGDEYLVLFDEDEYSTVSERYEIGVVLPGYEVIGLQGWDDFLVRDSKGGVFSVPTVPCIPKYLEPFPSLAGANGLTTDERYAGKIKWYIKPVVFGGDPASDENITWITHEEHEKLVRWWNALYRDLSRKY
jgi:hypothetical protein